MRSVLCRDSRLAKAVIAQLQAAEARGGAGSDEGGMGGDSDDSDADSLQEDSALRPENTRYDPRHTARLAPCCDHATIAAAATITDTKPKPRRAAITKRLKRQADAATGRIFHTIAATYDGYKFAPSDTTFYRGHKVCCTAQHAVCISSGAQCHRSNTPNQPPAFAATTNVCGTVL